MGDLLDNDETCAEHPGIGSQAGDEEWWRANRTAQFCSRAERSSRYLIGVHADVEERRKNADYTVRASAPPERVDYCWFATLSQSALPLRKTA